MIELGIDGLEDAELIGRGGYAAVYRANEPATKRLVAVKLLNAAVTEEKARTRFERECAALGQISEHPGIVSLYRVGFSESGQPFLVMPYLANGTLHDRLAKHGPVPESEVLDIAIQVLQALIAAHERGVLHCDLKPENVLVSPYGEPQLADFGIATIADATASTSLKGTPSFMAPELSNGSPPSEETDLYGAGALFHALLNGEPPFMTGERNSYLSILNRSLTQPPADLRPRGVSDRTASTIEALMAKEPAHRPTAAETIEVLETIRSDGPPPASQTPRAPDAAVAGSQTTVLRDPAPPTEPAPTDGQNPLRQDSQYRYSAPHIAEEPAPAPPPPPPREEPAPPPREEPAPPPREEPAPPPREEPAPPPTEEPAPPREKATPRPAPPSAPQSGSGGALIGVAAFLIVAALVAAIVFFLGRSTGDEVAADTSGFDVETIEPPIAVSAMTGAGNQIAIAGFRDAVLADGRSLGSLEEFAAADAIDDSPLDVAAADDGTMFVVRTAGGVVIAGDEPVRLFGDEDTRAITAGAGSIWLTERTNHTVKRLDSSGEVQAVIGVGVPGDVAVAGNDVWVASPLLGTIQRVDAVSNLLVSRIDVEGLVVPEVVTADTNSVWIMGPGSREQFVANVLARVDPVTEDVTRLDGVLAAGESPDDIVLAKGYLWVAVTQRDAVLQLDAITGELLAEIEIPGPVQLAATTTSLWISPAAELALRRIELRTVPAP